MNIVSQMLYQFLMENSVNENRSQKQCSRIHPLFIKNTSMVDSQLSFDLSEISSRNPQARVKAKKHPSNHQGSKIEG